MAQKVFYAWLFVVGLLASISVNAQDIPPQLAAPPKDWVSDFEHLLTPAQIDTLDQIIAGLEKATAVEICVVTLDTSWVRGEFSPFITSLGKRWGVGKKGVDNGIIIGITAIGREIRISTAYGIRTQVPDAYLQQLIDGELIPLFKQEKYYEALKLALQRIVAKIQGLE